MVNIALNKEFDCAFIYAFNGANERKGLWEDLIDISKSIQGAWIIAGDFNYPLHYDDRIGREVSYEELKDFDDCVTKCKIADLKQMGCKFT